MAPGPKDARPRAAQRCGGTWEARPSSQRPQPRQPLTLHVPLRSALPFATLDSPSFHYLRKERRKRADNANSARTLRNHEPGRLHAVTRHSSRACTLPTRHRALLLPSKLGFYRRVARGLRRRGGVLLRSRGQGVCRNPRQAMKATHVARSELIDGHTRRSMSTVLPCGLSRHSFRQSHSAGQDKCEIGRSPWTPGAVLSSDQRSEYGPNTHAPSDDTKNINQKAKVTRLHANPRWVIRPAKHFEINSVPRLI